MGSSSRRCARCYGGHDGARRHGVRLRWISRIEEWDTDRALMDRQVRGPYRFWHHRHEFQRHDDGTVVRDHVRYALPLALLSDLAHAAFLQRDLHQIFDFRRDAVRRLLGDAGTVLRLGTQADAASRRSSRIAIARRRVADR